MTYGDFAWSDVLRRTPTSRRLERPRSLFVEGDPVAWMDPGESDWSWRVSRALRSVREPIVKPHLRFTLGHGYRSRRASIDDYAKPVLEEVNRYPRSVWVEIRNGDRTGVKIGNVLPPFPPRIERVIEVPFGSKDDASEMREMLAGAPPLAGASDVGVHLAFGRVNIGNFEFGGPVRLIFDGLSAMLGGSESSPGDLRIKDLRVTRDPGRVDGCEIRLWTIDS